MTDTLAAAPLKLQIPANFVLSFAIAGFFLMAASLLIWATRDLTARAPVLFWSAVSRLIAITTVVYAVPAGLADPSQYAFVVFDALERGTIGFDAVKHLVLCRIERRPPRLDMTVYPYLPKAHVAATSADDYMALLTGSLEGLRFIPWRCQPGLYFVGRGQNYWHRLRVDRFHHSVRFSCEETEQVCCDFAFLDLADARPCRPNFRENEQRPLLVHGQPMQWQTLCRGGADTAILRNSVPGTTQQFSTPSHLRQCGDETFRMLVTPLSDFLPSENLDGVGIPQRALTNSRFPSPPLRTIGPHSRDRFCQVQGFRLRRSLLS
ncbi:hypothetical protein IMCC20628_00933 [Hoeflea sp. IMCC20628]|nr:hypothetical protein IMCC20628_00933 [Hoeflea sp. IMCC20628]